MVQTPINYHKSPKFFSCTANIHQLSYVSDSFAALRNLQSGKMLNRPLKKFSLHISSYFPQGAYNSVKSSLLKNAEVTYIYCGAICVALAVVQYIK